MNVVNSANKTQYAISAVKALIIHENHFLVLSKSKIAETTGIVWNDLPGGRVEYGESNPYQVLHRELSEEVGDQNIKVVKPIHMASIFQNPEVQIVATMFLCFAESSTVELSSEHADYSWVHLEDTETPLPDWIRESISAYFEEIKGE